MQEEVQEVKDELEDEEVKESGDQGRGRTAHFMHEMTCATPLSLEPLSHAMWCATHECADASRTRLNRQRD